VAQVLGRKVGGRRRPKGGPAGPSRRAIMGRIWRGLGRAEAWGGTTQARARLGTARGRGEIDPGGIVKQRARWRGLAGRQRAAGNADPAVDDEAAEAWRKLVGAAGRFRFEGPIGGRAGRTLCGGLAGAVVSRRGRAARRGRRGRRTRRAAGAWRRGAIRTALRGARYLTALGRVRAGGSARAGRRMLAVRLCRWFETEFDVHRRALVPSGRALLESLGGARAAICRAYGSSIALRPSSGVAGVEIGLAGGWLARNGGAEWIGRWRSWAFHAPGARAPRRARTGGAGEAGVASTSNHRRHLGARLKAQRPRGGCGARSGTRRSTWEAAQQISL